MEIVTETVFGAVSLANDNIDYATNVAASRSIRFEKIWKRLSPFFDALITFFDVFTDVWSLVILAQTNAWAIFYISLGTIFLPWIILSIFDLSALISSCSRSPHRIAPEHSKSNMQEDEISGPPLQSGSLCCALGRFALRVVLSLTCLRVPVESFRASCFGSDNAEQTLALAAALESTLESLPNCVMNYYSYFALHEQLTTMNKVIKIISFAISFFNGGLAPYRVILLLDSGKSLRFSDKLICLLASLTSIALFPCMLCVFSLAFPVAHLFALIGAQWLFFSLFLLLLLLLADPHRFRCVNLPIFFLNGLSCLYLVAAYDSTMKPRSELCMTSLFIVRLLANAIPLGLATAYSVNPGAWHVVVMDAVFSVCAVGSVALYVLAMRRGLLWHNEGGDAEVHGLGQVDRAGHVAPGQPRTQTRTHTSQGAEVNAIGEVDRAGQVTPAQPPTHTEMCGPAQVDRTESAQPHIHNMILAQSHPPTHAPMHPPPHTHNPERVPAEAWSAEIP